MTAPYAGVNAVLSRSGTPTAMVAEALSLISGSGATGIWQITNAAKRALDPSAVVVVYDNGVAISSALYTLSYMFGKVYLALGGAPTTPITMDATYIPTLAVAGCVALNPSFQRELIKRTTTGQVGIGGDKYLAGKFMGEGTIDNIEAYTLDQDPGAGTQSYWADFLGGGPVLLDAQLGKDATSEDPAWRAWVLIHGLDQSWGKDDLVKRPVKWTLSTYFRDNASFAFSDTVSTP